MIEYFIGESSSLSLMDYKSSMFFMNQETYDSLPDTKINYTCIILGISTSPSNFVLVKNKYFSNSLTFLQFYNTNKPKVLFVGKENFYQNVDILYIIKNIPKASNIYISKPQNTSEVYFLSTELINNFLTSEYKLISFINQLYQYSLYHEISNECVYLDFIKSVLVNGNNRINRTDVDTISTFGNIMRFHISDSIPLLTTKKINFQAIVEELLWMCRGDTDTKILQARGIHIWDGNSSRKFLDQRNLNHYPEGVIGPQYGFLWRFFGAAYLPDFADTSKCNKTLIGGFDQLKNVEHLLRTDPFSRRIIISSWSPDKINEQALPSCHYACQFYVTENKNSLSKHLSCMFTMRSNDLFLGCPYNIVFYSLLTYILAMKCDMIPNELIYSCGDSHLYTNHIDAVNTQLSRTLRPSPKVVLNKRIREIDWCDITVNDFDLIGYIPHPFIKAPMAI